MELLNLAANIIAAIGVLIAAYQIRLAKKQSMTTFEDSINKEYRDLVKSIPISALLGSDFSEKEINNNINIFYRYIDLTNEQIYLRAKGKISASTWYSWEEGIRTNFAKESFIYAFQEFRKINSNNFNELSRLLNEKNPSDPRKWD